MKVKDLIRYIADNGYPYDLVNFDVEYPNKAFCIRSFEAGKWEVYFSGRGQKSGLVTFDSESDACEYLLDEIKKGYN